MNRRSLALLAAGVLALNCRDALGIDELESWAGDPRGSAGSSVSGAQGAKGASGGGGGVNGSGGGSGKGLAGSGGTRGEAGSPGGPKGEAGAGAGGTGGEGSEGAGGAGTGGTGGAPGSPDECQRACVDAAPPAAVGEYFDAFAACACGVDDPSNCRPLCGPCDIDASNFDAQSAACIECVSLNAISTACAEAGGCGDDCESLRECLAECSE